MSVLRWLVTKDLMRFAADRNGALLTFVIPMVLASLLGVLFAPEDKATHLDVLVVDLDSTSKSKALVESMSETDSLNVTIVSEFEARRQIEKGDASVAVILPKGTGDFLTPSAMFGGAPLPAALLHDPSRKVDADLCAGLLTQIIMQEVGKQFSDPKAIRDALNSLKLGMTLKGANTEFEKQLLAVLTKGVDLANEATESALGDKKGPLGGGMKPPIELKKEQVIAAGPSAGYNNYAHSFAGMLCMFLLFWALDAGKELISERDAGSLLRVRASPASRAQVLTARATSAFIVALAMSAAIYALAMTVFEVRILGSLPGFLLVIVGQCLFVGGFTVLLAGVSRTERQVGNIGSFAILIMSFLGGAWMPTFVLPEWVQQLAQILPTHWVTNGLAAMTWRGLPFEQAVLPASVLTAQGLLCGFIGWLLYRWD